MRPTFKSLRNSAVAIITVVSLLLTTGRGWCIESAELVLLDGKIVTMDQRQPVVEALAARAGRVVAVGDSRAIGPYISDSTRVMRLDGHLALPGFIEGHGHFVSLGLSKMMLDLRSARSWNDIVRQVGAAAGQRPAGQWIIGRGWHQDKWDAAPDGHIDGYPRHDELSRVAPEHPVLLTHASGHMCIANGMAMRLAGISDSTRSPAGGEILRDDQGAPIGVFRETAQAPIHAAHDRSLSQRTAEQQEQELLRAIELATEECLAKGVTTFHDAGSSLATIDLLKRLADNGELKIRLWVMIREGNDRLARFLPQYRLVGLGNDHLTVRAIKRSIDGALGAHGAWLLEPYDDLPGSTGLNTTSIESLRETARLALKHDYQLCVHAIGDRANRETLDLFEEQFRAAGQWRDRRWRIEHAQHLHPEDIPRLARLGVIASMQAIHCPSDAVFVVQRLGQRRASQGAYVWRSLIDQQAVVINGTDAPVEDVNPLHSFHASVTRQMPSGVAFFPEQSMTRQEALRSYTLDAALAGFEEDRKGSLAPGKLADLVVLSRDIMTCPADQIRDTQVQCTIVGGKVLYEK